MSLESKHIESKQPLSPELQELWDWLIRDIVHVFWPSIQIIQSRFDDAIKLEGIDLGCRQELLMQANEEITFLYEIIKDIRDNDFIWQKYSHFSLDWLNRLDRTRKRVLARLGIECELHMKETSQAIMETTLHGNSLLFDRALMCLLENACLYADDLKGIAIQIDCEYSYWILRVSNAGHIPEGWDDIIFEIYCRGPNPNGDGLGMGLTNSRRAARMHHGDLVLEDSGRESGRVVFRLEWPISIQQTEETL